VTDIADTLAKKEIPRNRWYQPMVVPREGGKAVAMIRPSTLGGVLEYTGNLAEHDARHMAVGFAQRADLLAQVATADLSQKKLLNALCKEAAEAAGVSAKRNLGTAIHAAIESHLRGEEVNDLFLPFVQRFDAGLAAYNAHVDPDLIEVFCVNSAVGAAGSFDYIITIDGKTYTADLKTGSSMDFGVGKFSVQLSIYAGADSFYDWVTETHTDPVPVDQDHGIIVHLPADGDGPATLHFIDLEAGREAIEHALWVRKWRGRKDLLTPVPVPVAEAKPKPKRTLEPVPMPPLPASAEAKPKRKPKSAPKFDEQIEGPLVPTELADALRQRALASDNVETIRRWVAEAETVFASFAMGTGRHTERRYNIALAAVTLAEGGGDDEWARAVLSLVVKDASKPAIPVGAVLGALTLEEARRALQLAENATARYEDDGTLVVVEEL
jgi:hypothetical protein